MATMYHLNPLVDLQTPVTPAEILYRMENIHAALHKSATSTEDGPTTASEAYASVSTKKSKSTGSTKTEEKVPKQIAKNSKMNDVDVSTPAGALRELDAKLAKLRAIKDVLDKVEEPSIVQQLVMPYGRVLHLRNAQDKQYAVDRQIMKEVTTMLKPTDGKVCLLLTVPAVNDVAVWLMPFLELLAHRYGPVHIVQHVHSTAAALTIHDSPLTRIHDAKSSESARMTVRIIVKHGEMCSLPEMLVEGWPQRNQLLTGLSVPLALGYLAGITTQGDVPLNIQLVQQIADAQSVEQFKNACAQLVRSKVWRIDEDGKLKFAGGDSSIGALDLLLACTIAGSSYYDAQLTPKVIADVLKKVLMV